MRMLVRLSGIAPDPEEGDKNLIARMHGEGYTFRPNRVSGPKDLRDREVYVSLSRADVARILGATLAADLDPETFEAFTKVRRWLNGKRDG